MDELNRWRLELALLQAGGHDDGSVVAHAHEHFAFALQIVLRQRIRQHPLLGRLPPELWDELTQEVYLDLRRRINAGACPVFTGGYLDRRLLDARRRLERNNWRMRLVQFSADQAEEVVQAPRTSPGLPSEQCLADALEAALPTIPPTDSRFLLGRIEVFRRWAADIAAGHTPRGFPRRHPEVFARALSQPTRSRAVCDLLRDIYAALRVLLPELPEIEPGDAVSLRNQMHGIVRLVRAHSTPEPPVRQSGRAVPMNYRKLAGRDARLRRLVDLYARGLDRVSIARELARLPANVCSRAEQTALECLDEALNDLVAAVRGELRRRRNGSARQSRSTLAHGRSRRA